MGAYAHTTWLGQALNLLPRPVLRLLDGWSHRLALRKRLERQQRWQRRNAPPVVEQPVQYKLRPWRD
jgi:heme exporter protein D